MNCIHLHCIVLLNKRIFGFFSHLSVVFLSFSFRPPKSSKTLSQGVLKYDNAVDEILSLFSRRHCHRPIWNMIAAASTSRERDWDWEDPNRAESEKNISSIYTDVGRHRAVICDIVFLLDCFIDRTEREREKEKLHAHKTANYVHTHTEFSP